MQTATNYKGAVYYVNYNKYYIFIFVRILQPLQGYSGVFSNKISKDTSGTGRIRTHSLSQTSKEKLDKHILTNKLIVTDKRLTSR